MSADKPGWVQDDPRFDRYELNCGNWRFTLQWITGSGTQYQARHTSYHGARLRGRPDKLKATKVLIKEFEEALGALRAALRKEEEET